MHKCMHIYILIFQKSTESLLPEVAIDVEWSTEQITEDTAIEVGTDLEQMSHENMDCPSKNTVCDRKTLS